MDNKLIVIGLLVTSLFLGGCLTGSIKGQVINGQDRPVEGAIVTTDPPTHSVRTTESGYSLQGVPWGEYVVQAQKPGHKTGKEKILVRVWTTTNADIQILQD
ncbi:MAG: carboxypeptidase-like regulatory domain-containing protein [bacterium]